MRSQKVFLLYVVLFFGVVVWMRVAPAVLAAAPDHDDFDFARFVSPLAYSDTADTTEATTAGDDPFFVPNEYSVWYTFTPDSRMPIHADTFGSNYDTYLSVFTGDRGSLNLVSDNNDHGGAQSRVHFIANPGNEYHVMASSCCPFSGATGGNLNFFFYELPAPPNDNFVNATVIPEIPYPDTPLNGRSDAFASTLETAEPNPSCIWEPLGNSVWYAYTPSEDDLVSFALNHHPEYQVLAAYTGSSVGSLSEVGCRVFWPGDSGFLTIDMDAGTTYYFQAGNLFELGEYFWLSAQPPPPPVVYMYYYPSEPSKYDNIAFNAYGFDPANQSAITWNWNFGDGATGSGEYVNHQYATDGDYTVTLTGTTTDGRQTTTSSTVSVRTADVSIAKFTTPKNGHLGQTAKIVVGVANRLNPQNVRVELQASGPGGFHTIGSLWLYVPVQKNKTTDFMFSYTFTPQDAALGKVNFKAIAYIEPGRDALPGDNEAISFSVKVSSKAAAAGGITVNEVVEEEVQESFVLRSQQDENPDMQELFLLPSYWMYIPSIGSNSPD